VADLAVGAQVNSVAAGSVRPAPYSQTLQARKAPSPPGSPSTPSNSGRWRRTNPSWHSSRWTASTVPITRESSQGGNPVRGMSSSAASRPLLP
jgi:hypothetical protein